MKKLKKIIGFDMDGVIIDHTIPKITVAKSFGFTLKPAQTASLVMRNFLPEPVYRGIQKKVYDDYSGKLGFKVMPGIRKVLTRLKASGIQFILISRRSDKKIAEKILKTADLWPEFFNTGNTFFVETKADKNKIAKKMKVTHYIDDDSKVLDLVPSVPNRFIFDQYSLYGEDDYKALAGWSGSDIDNLLL